MMKKDLCGFYAYPKSLKKGLLFENIIIILVLLISVSISPFFKANISKRYDGISDNIVYCKNLTWQKENSFDNIENYTQYCEYIDKVKEEGDYYTSNIDGNSYVLNLNIIDLGKLISNDNPNVINTSYISCLFIDNYEQLNDVIKIKNTKEKFELKDNEFLLTKNFLEVNNLEENDVVGKVFNVGWFDIPIKLKAVIDADDQLRIFSQIQNPFCVFSSSFINTYENLFEYNKDAIYVKKANYKLNEKNANLLKDANLKYNVYNNVEGENTSYIVTKNNLTQDIISSVKTSLKMVNFVIYSFSIIAVAMYGFFVSLKLILKKDELYMRRLIGMINKEEFSLLMLSFNIYVAISLISSLLIYLALFICASIFFGVTVSLLQILVNVLLYLLIMEAMLAIICLVRMSLDKKRFNI